MGRLDSITLCLCFLLLVFSGTKGLQCEDRWFGDKCQYQCHCLNNAICDKTIGECPGVCDRGWFGPQCQYRDAAYYNPRVRLTDGDESSCLVGPELTEHFTMLDNVLFTWMRIVTNKPGIFDRVNMTFLSNNGTEVKPKSPLTKIYVSDTILELYGELQHRFQCIRLDFDSPETRQSFCSMYVSSGRNVAIKQNASQSSTISWDGIVGGAEKAVDGKPQQWWKGGSCTFTGIENSSYWSLNLSLPVTVNMYMILGRSENTVLCRIHYFRLDSYNQSTKVQQYDQKEPLNNASYDVYPMGTSLITSVTLSVSKDFWPNKRYICNDENPRMSFCEMQIYGDVVCEPGKWGRDCEKDCNCQDPSESCFVSTGMCPSGCKVGFHGPECQQECADGQWGISCQNSCDKCLNGKCNKTSGECLSGCIQGYKSPFCVQECDLGFHGYNCIFSCPENCRNKTCNKVDGLCIECEAGYQGPLCAQVCDVTSYGQNCATPCSDKCIDQLCHHITGVCDKCPYGKQISKDCSKDCDAGFHGFNCIQPCPANCQDNICDNVDGKCTKCVAGYQGLVCNQECDATFYGEDCASPCSDRCIDQLCHHITGVCDNCPDGKQISMDCSQDCSDGFFGPRCANQCSEHCGGDGFCHYINGKCISGCKPGYTSDNCEQTCDHTTYGEGCNKTCSVNCVVNATQEPAVCTHVNGQCLLGCVSGYSGISCEEITSDPDNVNLVVILVPLLLVLIVVTALVIGHCLWRRRKGLQNDGTPVQPDDGHMHGDDVELEDNLPPDLQHAVDDNYDKISLDLSEGNPHIGEIERTSKLVNEGRPIINEYDKTSPYINEANPPYNEYEKIDENRQSHIYTEPED